MLAVLLSVMGAILLVISYLYGKPYRYYTVSDEDLTHAVEALLRAVKTRQEVNQNG